MKYFMKYFISEWVSDPWLKIPVTPLLTVAWSMKRLSTECRNWKVSVRLCCTLAGQQTIVMLCLYSTLHAVSWPMLDVSQLRSSIRRAQSILRPATSYHHASHAMQSWAIYLLFIVRDIDSRLRSTCLSFDGRGDDHSKMFLLRLTLYGHIKTAEQRTQSSGWQFGLVITRWPRST